MKLNYILKLSAVTLAAALCVSIANAKHHETLLEVAAGWSLDAWTTRALFYALLSRFKPTLHIFHILLRLCGSRCHLSLRSHAIRR